jgi:7-cyano-7-deazaguanine synthase
MEREGRKGGREQSLGVDGDAVCVLVSGGMDSCVLVDQLSRDYSRVYPLYIRTGLLWEETELYWLRRFLRRIAKSSIVPLSVLDLPMGDTCGSHWGFNGENIPDGVSPDESVYLPGRNILLLSKAAVFCMQNGIEIIAIGILKGNPFPDSSSLSRSLLRFYRWGWGVRFWWSHPSQTSPRMRSFNEVRGFPWS